MLCYFYISFVIIKFCKIELLLVLLLFIYIIFLLIFFFNILWCSGLFRNVPDLIDGWPKSLGQFWLHTI